MSDKESKEDIRFLSMLYDKLYSALTYAPHQDISVNNQKSNYLHLCNPGIPVNPKDYENLVTPTNITDGNLNASFGFANLVNKIPLVHPVYGDSGKDVEKVYALLKSANITENEPDERQLKKYQKAYDFLNIQKTVIDFDEDFNEVKRQVPAKSPIYERYEKLQRKYAIAVTKYKSALTSLDLDNPKDQRMWDAQSRILQYEVDSAYDELSSGGASTVRNALSLITHSINQASAQILMQSMRDFDNSSITSGGTKFHMTYPQVSNWASMDNSLFADLKISTKEVEKHYENKKHHTQIGASFIGLFGGSGSHSSDKTTKTSKSSDIEINFKFAQIGIVRPWLNFSLLAMKGWNFSNDIVISDGLNKGQMPLMPTAMIIAKDIKIKGNWSKTDSQILSKATSANAGRSFGPFMISGKHKSSKTTSDLKSKFEGGELSVPGTQIMGWLSTIVPKCPS